MPKKEADPREKTEVLIERITTLKSDIAASKRSQEHLDEEREDVIAGLKECGVEFEQVTEYLEEEATKLETLADRLEGRLSDLECSDTAD